MAWSVTLRSAIAGILCCLSTYSLGNDFPQRPITLIVPLPAGAVVDLAARLYADVVSRNIGQRIVVDNRSSAAGIVAAMATKQAAPDGYTLYMAHIGSLALLPAMQKVQYDPIADFAPITLLISYPTYLTVPAGSTARSAADIVERAKSETVKLASQGVGSGAHVLGAMWQAQTNVSFVHVPYRGTAQMLPDLVANRVDMTFSGYSSTQELVSGGSLKLLAIAAPIRSMIFPAVPTMEESGFPGVYQDTWFGLVAPAGTPRAVIQKLNEEFSKAAKDPVLLKRLTTDGTNVVVNSPQDFAELIRSEAARWGVTIRQLGIKAE
jgi:tripartite-type tricarboxylate transporter receptor subunit TctC